MDLRGRFMTGRSTERGLEGAKGRGKDAGWDFHPEKKGAVGALEVHTMKRCRIGPEQRESKVHGPAALTDSNLR